MESFPKKVIQKFLRPSKLGAKSPPMNNCHQLPLSFDSHSHWPNSLRLSCMW